MHCEDRVLETADTTLHIALDDLRMTWAAMQIGQKGILDRMPLTDIEVCFNDFIWVMSICIVTGIAVGLLRLFKKVPDWTKPFYASQNNLEPQKLFVCCITASWALTFSALLFAQK